MDLDAFRQLDPEHDYEYAFVHHLLHRRGVAGSATAEHLHGALAILSDYEAAIGDQHDEEAEIFWHVWEPGLSGMLRAEAYLLYGITRPSRDQWREIFGRLCGPDAAAYLDGAAMPPVESPMIQ